MSNSAGAARSVTGDKSAGVPIGVAGGKGPGVSIGIGGEKGAAGIGSGGGEKSVGMSIGAEAGKSAGVSIGIGLGDSAGGAQSSSTGRGDAETGASSEKTGAGVSCGGVSMIPESVVAPLIGAGANVYIMTNELTQSMRQKIGTSWPVVQDTLNSRYAKMLAGGLLASVTVVIVWKIIKRLSSKGKKPADSDDDDASQWTTAKTYELTPVPERKQQRQQAPKSEGDGAFTLPHKIQLRITDTPLQAAKAGDPETCKARDPATRHRHTRHLESRSQVRAGEQAATASGYSPWHSEHHRSSDLSSNCACPNSEQCGCGALLPPQPRLLYSVRESRMVQRALDPNLENVLTYTSCPSTLCSPALVGSGACAHSVGPKSCCLSPHTCVPCGALLPPGTAPLVSHHPLFHSPLTEVMTTTPGHLSCPAMQAGVQHSNVHGISYVSTPDGEAMKTGAPWPAGGVSVYSVQESHPMSSESGVVEGKVRSVTQQTDGEVDSDMPGHGTDAPRSVSFQTGRHGQNVPTRTAQSPVAPSQCTNTPFRADNRSSATCPARFPTQSCMPTVCHTPQVFQLSTAGGECPGSYPAVHPHSVPFHTQHPSAMDGFSSRALSLPPLSYHPHVSSVLPSLIQQHQHLSRVQPQHSQQQQQQQQQPVVQHPSDSSCSQNSTEACPSQESRQYEGSQTTTVSQETAAAEALSQERALLPQQPYGRAAAPAVSPPHPAIGHHHASSLRALTDYAHADYPWHRPQAFHSYQPSPVCLLGYQSPNSKHYLPQHSVWPTHQAMFLTPSGGLVVSSPGGMFAASTPALLPSPQQMAGHWQAPYLYPQGPMTVPKHTTFNSNFNLSNSNAQAFMQEAAQNSVQALPLPQESSRLRVIGSDHSVSGSQADNTTVIKAESATCTSSEISLQAVEADAAAEVLTNKPQPIPGSAPEGKDVKTIKSCVTSPTELASNEKEFSDEKDAVPSLDAVTPEDIAHEQETGAAAELGGEPQADACTMEHAEEAAASFSPPPCCTIAASALSDGGETQL